MPPSESEVSRRDHVLSRLREHIRSGATIPYRPPASGQEPEFGGFLGAYVYLFEGEDDLLHLKLERRDGHILTPEETAPYVRFLLPEVPEALVWLRPGELAHHYYLGHDLLCPSE